MSLTGLTCFKFLKWNILTEVDVFDILDISDNHLYFLFNRDAVISAAAFHPTRKMAVSSSYGGDFKVILMYCF